MAATKKGTTAKKATRKAAPKAKVKSAAKANNVKTAAQPKAAAKAALKTKPRAAARALPKAAAKKTATLKLTPKQTDFLTKVQAAGEAGYLPARAETRGLEGLITKKVVKKGAKDKVTGEFRVFVTKVGAKHLASAPTPVPAPPAAD